ncbi:expansin-b16 [Phtheirospermum japonicum]|uniref:Expansin-b16 n=1 Tax=Phtheirospermum japonicum TaxID=374723 RepID=A0A830B3I5_9LAMI|nr:expansin-b16 [Phtheirospermum japonicum]
MGDGSDGGACGYERLIHANGYKTRETAVSDVLFRNGLGCGACYKVMCFGIPFCNKKAVTVVVMDQSPGGFYPHFDLSGSAFGRLATNGSADRLRNVGKIKIVWKRTKCTYNRQKIGFHVMIGSTSYWLSLRVQFVNGDGDIGSMQIKEGSSDQWQNMTQVWGATWSAHPQSYQKPLQGPFSIKLTSGLTKKTLFMRNVIPSNWEPQATYISHVNF